MVNDVIRAINLHNDQNKIYGNVKKLIPPKMAERDTR